MQLRILANGSPCCASIDAHGNYATPTHVCDECAAHFGASNQPHARRMRVSTHQENDMSYAPPDPYTLALKQQRSRLASDQLSFERSSFEDDWRNQRLTEIATTRAALDGTKPQRRMTAAELSTYAAPNPYDAPLAARRKENR